MRTSMICIHKRGFTLIEILVVIAIIGILASVVMGSVNTARDKGTNASFRSSLNNMRAQVQIFYDDNGTSYTGVCNDPNVIDVLTSTGGQCLVGGLGTLFAMAVDLVGDDTGNVYCIDSTGVSGDFTVAEATEVADSVCDGDGT